MSKAEQDKRYRDKQKKLREELEQRVMAIEHTLSTLPSTLPTTQPLPTACRCEDKLKKVVGQFNRVLKEFDKRISALEDAKS